MTIQQATAAAARVNAAKPDNFRRAVAEKAEAIKAKAPAKKIVFNREYSVIDTLKAEGSMTKAELAKAADKVYVSRTKASPNVKQSEWVTKCVIIALRRIGVVEESGDSVKWTGKLN